MAKKKKPPRNVVTPEKAKRIREEEERQEEDRQRQMDSPAALVVKEPDGPRWFWAVWQRWKDDPVAGGFARTQEEAMAKTNEAAALHGGVTTWTAPSAYKNALDYLKKNNRLT